jgi:ribosome-associated protein
MKTELKSTADVRTKLETLCAWLAEKKATELVALDLSGLQTKQGKNFITEGIIIAGSISTRHGQGLADFVLERAKYCNYEFLQLEGYKNGLWILLDFNDVVVNILKQEQRQLYRLEDLYSGATVVRDDREAA